MSNQEDQDLKDYYDALEKIQGGGPAFSMSLRDYFAAKVVASLLSNGEAMDVASQECEDSAEMMGLLAERSYAMADAMLAERAK